MKKRVLSGVQATGLLHLGNYLGAIRYWVKMQEDYECYFFLADLHAITVDQNPEDLKNAIYNTTAAYVASGINPEKVVLFAQSDVKEHAELAWILNCNTPIGWLKRMTQFKDKAGKNQEQASCGLFTYPVLMASDILLYDADFVPVGEDQKQHLELTRDIASSINTRFGKEILRVPEPLIQGVSSRVKSLRDGSKKMSKSDPSDNSRINLSDSRDEIISKIKKAKTDSLDFISYDKDRPEIANLLEIFSSISNQTIESLLENYAGKGFAVFKSDLAECLAENLSPITGEYNKLLMDKPYLEEVLRKGKDKASDYAAKTVSRVKKEFGFLNL